MKEEDEEPKLLLIPPSHLPNKHCRQESDQCTGIGSQQSAGFAVLWFNLICFIHACFLAPAVLLHQEITIKMQLAMEAASRDSALMRISFL